MSDRESVRAPVDPASLTRLGEELGDAEFVVELVVTLVEELPARIARGEQAATSGDEVASRREAHSLASVSQQLGGWLLAERARAVEHAAGAWDEVARAALVSCVDWRAWLATVDPPAPASLESIG